MPSVQQQCRHQLRIDSQRMTWWIPLIMLAGCAVSLLGLYSAIAEFEAQGFTPGLFVFGGFALLLGWGAVGRLLLPLLIRPRIVPYFTRPLGEYGHSTTAAFRRGRGVYREMAALDERAARLGVEPLSAFGFAYDHYQQQVQWHPAANGLRTVAALREGLESYLSRAPEVAQDLAALAIALSAAAEQGVEFSLTLRLHASDNLQTVMTREVRQGSFW